MYLILDIYSRKIVGFEVHETDDSDHAVALLRRTALAEGVHALAEKLQPGASGAPTSALRGAFFRVAVIIWICWALKCCGLGGLEQLEK